MLPDGGVAGPLDAEHIAKIESFGPESLVCPEHFHGSGDHAWIRAGFIGELRQHFPRDLRLIPPDPTLAEAAAVGSIEDRVLELEGLLLNALERLRERGRDVGDLKRQSREREREVLRMRAALKQVSSRVGGLGRLDIKLKRMTEALEIQEKDVGAIRKSFEGGLEKAAESAAKTVAEAHAMIQEATRIAEKAVAFAKKNKKVSRKKKRNRPKRTKKSGPDHWSGSDV